jgi:hypothetical protein
MTKTMPRRSLRGSMTTGEVADLINSILDMPGAYSRNYIRQEVECGALVARVYDRRGKKARIRIHPDDFLTWARGKVRADQVPRLDASVKTA